jgi:hypothetical protein
MNSSLKCLLFAFALVPGTAKSDCIYAGQSYSEGAEVCLSGFWARCRLSSWQGMGIPCVKHTPDGAVWRVPAMPIASAFRHARDLFNYEEKDTLIKTRNASDEAG